MGLSWCKNKCFWERFTCTEQIEIIYLLPVLLSKPLNQLPWFLGSVITSNGNLTPNFEYIADLRAANESKNNVIPGDFTSEKKVSLNSLYTLGTGVT